MKLIKAPGLICPKPGCGGTKFVTHPDGVQCLNCMKIIYLEQEHKKKGGRREPYNDRMGKKSRW